MNTYAYALTVLLSIQVQCSVVPSLPSETVTIVVATTVGLTPKPTESPAVVDLLERQAYFSTCAYYSGTPYACAASGYVCATNIYNYAACCPMNNLAGCTIAVACVDYTAYAAYGYNPYLYQFNTGICTDANLPYCTAKIWNYATPYTELGCGAQRAFYTLDPNPDIPSGPAAAPAQPDESNQGSSGSDASGQSINGDQNTQISGDGNTIYSTTQVAGKFAAAWGRSCRCFWRRPSLDAKFQTLLGGWGIPVGTQVRKLSTTRFPESVLRDRGAFRTYAFHYTLL